MEKQVFLSGHHLNADITWAAPDGNPVDPAPPEMPPRLKVTGTFTGRVDWGAVDNLSRRAAARDAERAAFLEKISGLPVTVRDPFE